MRNQYAFTFSEDRTMFSSKDEKADRVLRKWKSIFDAVATNGTMGLIEFQHFAEAIGMHFTPDELRETFNLIDENGDGYFFHFPSCC